MNKPLSCRSGLSVYSSIAIAVGLSALVLAGCVVAGGGYGYDEGAGAGVGLGYYEPYGSYYGGWGPGYRVAPSRGASVHQNRGGARPPPRAYRPPPASRTAPSIPSRPRPRGSPPH